MIPGEPSYADSFAFRNAVCGFRQIDRLAVQVHLAAFEPLGCTPARSGVGATRQPQIEPHARIDVRNDPLLHLVQAYSVVFRLLSHARHSEYNDRE